MFGSSCSEDVSEQNVKSDSQEITQVSSKTSPLDREDGYIPASGYEFDFIFLKLVPEFIEKHRENFSHMWAGAYDCEYAKRVMTEGKGSLDSLADTALQTAMDEANEYPSKIKELTKMDILPYSNKSGDLKPILYRKRNYSGDKETEGCDVTKKMYIEHETFMYMFRKLRKDINVDIPDIFFKQINDGAKSVRVESIIKYRVESSEAHYLETAKKYRGNHSIVVEEMELYKNKEDLKNGKPFKILYETDLYDI